MKTKDKERLQEMLYGKEGNEFNQDRIEKELKYVKKNVKICTLCKYCEVEEPDYDEIAEVCCYLFHDDYPGLAVDYNGYCKYFKKRKKIRR